MSAVYVLREGPNAGRRVVIVGGAPAIDEPGLVEVETEDHAPFASPNAQGRCFGITRREALAEAE